MNERLLFEHSINQPRSTAHYYLRLHSLATGSFSRPRNSKQNQTNFERK